METIKERACYTKFEVNTMKNRMIKEEANRLVLYDNETEIGELTWREYEDYYDVNHTYTNPEYRGQGIAGQLLDAMAKKAIKDQKLIQPTCPYISHKFDTEPDKYAGLDARTRAHQPIVD